MGGVTSVSRLRWSGRPRGPAAAPAPGRGQSSPPEQARLARARYEARDVTVAEIARALGVGRGTIYRAVPLFLGHPVPGATLPAVWAAPTMPTAGCVALTPVGRHAVPAPWPGRGPWGDHLAVI